MIKPGNIEEQKIKLFMGIKKQNVVPVSEREEATIQPQNKSGTRTQLPNFSRYIVSVSNDFLEDLEAFLVNWEVP